MSNTQESIQKLTANGYKSPIYATEVQFGETADVVGNQMATFGAFHGVFVPLFDKDSQNYAALVGEAYQSQGAQDLADKFQDYLFNFISTGNPNGSGLSQWDAWSADQANLLSMDASKEQAVFEMVKKSFTYEDVLKQIQEDQTIGQEQKEALLSQVLNGRWFSYGLDQAYGNLSTFDQ